MQSHGYSDYLLAADDWLGGRRWDGECQFLPGLEWSKIEQMTQQLRVCGQNGMVSGFLVSSFSNSEVHSCFVENEMGLAGVTSYYILYIRRCCDISPVWTI